MAETYEELTKFSREELVSRHDETAGRTSVGLNLYRDEIARRDIEEQTRDMRAMTRQMRNLTVFIAVLTAVNLLFLIVSIIR